jgi:hypothetical protein
MARVVHGERVVERKDQEKNNTPSREYDCWLLFACDRSLGGSGSLVVGK